MQYFDIIQAILKKPRKFFSKMPKTSFIQALLFFAINTIIGAALFAIIMPYVPMHELYYGYMDSQVVYFFQTLAMSAFMILILPAIVGLGLKIVKGKGSYEDTFKVYAYTSFTKLVEWIPFIGWIASVYRTVAIVIGLSQVHKLSTWRTIGGVLVGFIMLAGVAAIMLFLFGAGLGTYMVLTNST